MTSLWIMLIPMNEEVEHKISIHGNNTCVFVGFYFHKVHNEFHMVYYNLYGFSKLEDQITLWLLQILII